MLHAFLFVVLFDVCVTVYITLCWRDNDGLKNHWNDIYNKIVLRLTLQLFNFIQGYICFSNGYLW